MQACDGCTVGSEQETAPTETLAVCPPGKPKPQTRRFRSHFVVLVTLLRFLNLVRWGFINYTITRLTRRAGLRRRLAKSGLSPRGKTELFLKKVTKKSPKMGSSWINPTGTISQFFHEFPGSPKIQVEMPEAGKGGEAGGYAPRENH